MMFQVHYILIDQIAHGLRYDIAGISKMAGYELLRRLACSFSVEVITQLLKSLNV